MTVRGDTYVPLLYLLNDDQIMLTFMPSHGEHADCPFTVLTPALTVGIFLMVSIALMTLGNSVRVLLPTALLS